MDTYPSDVAGDALSIPQPATDVQDRLAEDIACRHCGYNLRGLHTEGACPECGAAIGWSILGDFLRYSDPRWVGTLAEGMNWLLASVVAAFVLGCVGQNVAQSAGGQEGALLAAALDLLPSLVGVVGYWKLTTPEPTEQPAVELVGGIDARRTARWALIGSVLLGVGQVMVQPGSASNAMMYMGTGLAITSAILGIVGVVALLTYARRIARRIPDDRLARHTAIVLWGFVGMYVLAAVAAVFVYAAVSSGGSAVGGVSVLVFPLLLVGYLVLGIWSLVLLVWYRRRLTAAAHHARTTWARQSTSA